MEDEQKIRNIWETCLDLALESYNNGSMGISAVVTTSSYDILSTGRNYLYEEKCDNTRICNSVISHAEMNAIHALGQSGMRMRDLVLFTTVEPCPMCIGAVGMSRISKLLVGSRDHYAGSISELSTNPYLKRKNIDYEFLRNTYERYFAAVHYLGAKRALSDRPKHNFFNFFDLAYREISKKIEEETENGGLKNSNLSKESLINIFEKTVKI